MEDIDYAARVAKGVALLDEKRPGWEQLINLDRLDIRDGTVCVTAQLSGESHWHAGMTQLGLHRDTYIAHGFNAESDSCDCCDSDDVPEGYVQEDAYDALNALWKGVITERRTATPKD
jgi:hypothetical protein